MGVPGFFKWLLQKHKRSMRKYYSDKPDKTSNSLGHVGALLIDLNSAFYDAERSIIEEKKRELVQEAKDVEAEREDDDDIDGADGSEGRAHGQRRRQSSGGRRRSSTGSAGRGVSHKHEWEIEAEVAAAVTETAAAVRERPLEATAWPEGIPETVLSVLRRVCLHIHTLVEMSRPDDLVYIALDGPAPAAKQPQQRSRRYRPPEGSHSDDKLATEAAELGLDMIGMTPGAALLETFSRGVCLFLEKVRGSGSKVWGRVKQVVLSDVHIPGEGEHKMLDAARAWLGLPGSDPQSHSFAWETGDAPRGSMVLVSPDADLMILGLSLLARARRHAPVVVGDDFDIFVWRELRGRVGELKDVESRGSLQLPSIGFTGVSTSRWWHDLIPTLIAESEAEDDQPEEWTGMQSWRPKKPHPRFIHMPPQGKEIQINAILDWSMMLCTLGNDFLPRLPLFKVDAHSIRLLTQVYASSGREFPDPLFYLLEPRTGDGSWRVGLNIRRLTDMLNRLAELEAAHDATALEGMAAFANALDSDSGDDVSSVDLKTAGATSVAEGTLQSVERRHPRGEDSPSPTPTPQPGGSAAEDPSPVGIVPPATDDSTKEEYYGKTLRSRVIGEPLSTEGQPLHSTPVRQMAEAWWAGLAFVAEYYLLRLPSWDYFYPYYYSPFPSDIQDEGERILALAAEGRDTAIDCLWGSHMWACEAETSTVEGIVSVLWDKGTACSPIELMLCALSPYSWHWFRGRLARIFRALAECPGQDPPEGASELLAGLPPWAEWRRLFPHREDVETDAEDAEKEFQVIWLLPAVLPSWSRSVVRQVRSDPDWDEETTQLDRKSVRVWTSVLEEPRTLRGHGS